MSDMNDTVNVDQYLSVNKFDVDEECAHIELVDRPSEAEFLKLTKVCPAGLYKLDKTNGPTFDYAGCLECGTCRVACGTTIVEKWRYPRPTMGVEYRLG